MTFDVNNSERLRIDSSGNVGIGISSPDGKLHIQDGSAGTVTAAAGANDLVIETSQTSGMSILCGAGWASVIQFGGGTDNNIANIGINDTTGIMTIGTAKAGGSMKLRVADGVDAMTLDSSGNVGIGTTSPSTKLEVLGGSNSNYLRLSGDDASGGRALDFTSFSSGGRAGAGHTLNAKSVDGVLAFATAGAERMRITSAGNVGIGTTSPASELHIDSATTSTTLTIESDVSPSLFTSGIDFLRSGTAKGARIESLRDAGAGGVGFNFLTTGNNAEEISGTLTSRMIIDRSGNLLVGATTTSQVTTPTTDGIYLSYNGVVHTARNSASTSNHHVFINSNGSVGTISTNGTSTSYNTSSDYRLKENVVTDWDATTRLKQLKPSRFNFIADADTTVDGFLAHEVQDIVPEAISGTKDATEELTNVVINNVGNVIAKDIEEDDWTAGKEDETYPSDSTWEATHTANVYQGIDQSKLVPLLVKTIQELEARITALES
jgi:hypothetical protein